MKEEQDYIRDIAEIRSMMERSTKFLSLVGWAGIMAGIYALTGAYIAYKLFSFNPVSIIDPAVAAGSLPSNLVNVIVLAMVVLVLAVGTAVFLSTRKANRKGEKIWNLTARRLLMSMLVPLVTGGLVILVFLFNGMTGLIAPFTLLFYGIALFNAGNFTFEEVKSLGVIEIVLGLIGCYFTEYGLLLWSVGFGVLHIIYGIYMHYKYER